MSATASSMLRILMICYDLLAKVIERILVFGEHGEFSEASLLGSVAELAVKPV